MHDRQEPEQEKIWWTQATEQQLEPTAEAGLIGART